MFHNLRSCIALTYTIGQHRINESEISIYYIIFSTRSCAYNKLMEFVENNIVILSSIRKTSFFGGIWKH